MKDQWRNLVLGTCGDLCSVFYLLLLVLVLSLFSLRSQNLH